MQNNIFYRLKWQQQKKQRTGAFRCSDGNYHSSKPFRTSSNQTISDFIAGSPNMCVWVSKCLFLSFSLCVLLFMPKRMCKMVCNKRNYLQLSAVAINSYHFFSIHPFIHLISSFFFSQFVVHRDRWIKTLDDSCRAATTTSMGKKEKRQKKKN